MAKGKTIEELFSDSFKGEELAPPSGLKDSVFDSLDAYNIESKYRDAFANEEIVPRPAVWSRISRALWIAGFLSFKYNKLNVYYVVAGLVGATGIIALQENKSANDVVAPIVQQVVVASNDIENDQSASQKEVRQQEETPIQKTEQLSSATKHGPILESGGDVDEQTHNKVAKETVVVEDPIEFRIVGPDKVCVGGSGEYMLEPNRVDCQLVASSALVEGGLVRFVAAGRHEVSFVDSKSGTFLARMTVLVYEDEIPQIVGKDAICMHATDGTFRVRSKEDIGVTYVWDFAQNTHRVLGNGYVKMEPEQPGVDTLRLMKINENTGCVSYAVKTVAVLEKPDAGFSTVKYGNLLVELSVPENARVAHSSWYLDGLEVEPANGIVELDEAGEFSLVHVVEDRAGCVDSAQRTISVESFSLFVPDAFAPGTSVAVFKPTGNGLELYSIAIYNASNQKIWESTLLDNGSPAIGWDGIWNGKVQPAGMYYYRISARFVDGSVWKGVKKSNGYSTTGTFFLVEHP